MTSPGGSCRAMLAAALSQLGEREQAGNRTKYGAWYGADGQPWCAMFISWCAAQAALPQQVLPRMAYCPYLAGWFQETGRWLPATAKPQSGDIVFFDANGNGQADHVGLVERVSGNMLYTVEGNAGDAVARGCYRLDDARLFGYGRPAYQEVDHLEEIAVRLEDAQRVVRVRGFLLDGTNYLRLRDIELLAPVRVDWDAAARIATVKAAAARAEA